MADAPCRSRRSRWTHVPTIVVAGTSMNAGKTTTVASLVHDLTAAGLRVGAGKFTGTGAGGDRYSFEDAGAAEILDCTDMGQVSTYRVPVERLAEVAARMHDTLAARGVDVIVLEIADGVLHSEICELLGHRPSGAVSTGPCSPPVTPRARCSVSPGCAGAASGSSPCPACSPPRRWPPGRPRPGSTCSSTAPPTCVTPPSRPLLERTTDGAVDAAAPTRASLAVAGE